MSKVEVYSKDQCPKCQSTKMFLKMKGVEFTEINITKRPEFYDEMKEIADEYGITSMPIVVGDEFEPISGFNPDALSAVFGAL